MKNVLKHVCCMLSIVFAKAFRHLDQSLHQTSEEIFSPLSATTNLDALHENSNRNDHLIPKKFISALDIPSIHTLKHKSHQGSGYLAKPVESVRKHSFHISEINQVNHLPYFIDSHGNAEKIMFKRHTSDKSDPNKLSSIEPKYSNHSNVRNSFDYNDSYPQIMHPSRQIAPVLHNRRSYTHGRMNKEENEFDKKRQDNSHPPIESSRESPTPSKYVNFHLRKPAMPSHVNIPPSKPYFDSPFSSRKQFKVVVKEPLRNTYALDKHVLSKSIYHSDPQLPSRLQPFPSNWHSNEDNFHSHNLNYLRSTSSEGLRNPIQDDNQSIQNLKYSPNDLREMQLQKQSSHGDKGSIHYLGPSLPPSFLFAKHHSRSQLPMKEGSIFSKKPQRLLPTFTEEKLLTPSTPMVQLSANYKSQPPYQLPPQTNQLNSQDLSHTSKDSRRRMFPQFDKSIEKIVDSNHGSTNHFSSNIDRNNFPLDHIRSNDGPKIPENVNFLSNVQEIDRESESSQSQERLFFPLHTPEEQNTRNYLPPINLYKKPLDLHKEFTSDEEEDILAAKVKALLNPPANHSVKDNQPRNELTNNLPPTNDPINFDTERQISPKHTTDKDDAIVSLESDPEPESEEDSGDNKDIFSEEQHDGFLDMGAYTDKQGSFGWYADFPVGRGHDKVSYSSSK